MYQTWSKSICILVYVWHIYMLMIFLSRWRGIIRDVPSSEPWPAKQQRPAGGWPAEPPPTIKSVQYFYEEERQRESSQNYENYPFLYPYVLYVSFTPVKRRAPRRRFISSLTWFDWPTGLINIKGCSWPKLKIQRPDWSPKSGIPL